MAQLEPLALGVMTRLHGEDPHDDLQKVADMGFPSCQLSSPPVSYLRGDRAGELTERFRQAMADTGVTVTSVFIMFPGHIWNLFGGPRTIGLVPPDVRGERMIQAVRIANWAASAGVGGVTSHVGFIPEDPEDANYQPFVRAMQAFIDYCLDLGLTFAFETGQETPCTLVRALEDIDRPKDKVGINLDPANLLLYGKGVPMDNVDLLAPYVLNTHCKDGKPPAPGEGLGKEYPLGDGDVNIRELIPALYERGFRGPLTIEREISGPQQIEDIQKAKALLEGIRAKLLG